MRYIKPFNENTENLKDELLDLCEGSLAYLMDDDYRVMITRRDSLPIDSEYHSEDILFTFINGLEVKQIFLNFQRLRIISYHLYKGYQKNIRLLSVW